MKKIILFTAILVGLNLSAQNYNTITDVTFTDVDGQTHNLNNLLGQGYRVILDFGFIGCSPCAAWSQHIGPALWDQYGPDGDNTLRIFYFEVNDETDQYVEQYYTDLGVEYPIVNLNFENSVPAQYQAYFDANILDGGYPVHTYVCQDTTYRIDIGYQYPQSLYIAEHILENSCNGQDVHYDDVALVGTARPFSYCSQSSSAIDYTPHLSVYHNGGIVYSLDPNDVPPQTEFSINDVFFVKTYINNVYLRTDTLNPNDTGGDIIDMGTDNNQQDDIGAGVEWNFLLPTIQVQLNDSVKFELLYPEDSYMNNNTYSFKVEQAEETKTASNNLLRLDFDHPSMYAYFCTEEQVSQEFAGQDIIISQGTDTLLTINNGECYAISIINGHIGNAYLIQSNNNDTIFKHTVDGTSDFSKFYYFNVDSTATSIVNYNAQAKPIRTEYFDLLGKKQKTNRFSHLAKGVFVEVKHFDNGYAEQRKVLKLE